MIKQNRRDFLKGSMAGTAGLVVASTTSGARGAESGKKQKLALATDGNVTNKVDVLVVGGGTAGTIAAIQAGQAGAKTLLLERNSKLGGTTTTGGVSFPGLFDAWGKQIIDCTGGAEVVGMLNLPRLREEETQPGSMLFKLDKANNPGRPNGPGSGLLDCYYIDGADSTNSRTVTAANLKGRKAVLERVRKEKKRLMHMQPEASFRESYRIEGEIVITVDDYTSGRVFEDAICYAFYPVDVHKGTGFDRLEHLKPGIVPTIPLRALIPKDSRNIMVAGRCVSSDRYANGGFRVQASCMAMGQAAGVAAALAVVRRTTPLDLPLSEIHKLLREHGAIVPA